MSIFGKIVTAMVTPFDASGEVDYATAVKLAQHLLNTKTDTLLLAGTTGESPTLTHQEEHKLFYEIRHNLPNAKIMAGTGSNCTRTAVKASIEAEKLGMDSILQVVPYYNKPSQEGIYQHFKAVSEATSLPIMLYNIPGRTSKNMAPETIARLAELENIVAVKEAAGSVDQVKNISKLVPEGFEIYSGDDDLTLEFIEEGAVGVVSVASHLVGEEIAEMIQKKISGDTAGSDAIYTKLKALFEVLFITSNPAPVKAALAMVGVPVGGLRLPLVGCDDGELLQIRQVLEGLNLI